MVRMNKKIIPLLLLFFLTILGYSISSSFISLYLKQTGTSELNIGIIFSLWPLFVILFAPLAGKLSDRIGRKWLLVLSSLGYASFGFLAGFQQFIPAFIILGISNAFLWTVGRAYVFDVAKGTKAKEVGYFFFSAIAGSMVGPLLAGKLVETINFIPTFFAGGILVLSGSFIGILFLKESNFSIKKEKQKIGFSGDFSILMLVAVILAFLSPTTSIFLPILMNDIGFTAFDIGIIFFVTKLFMAISQIAGARIYDRFGSKISMLGGCGLTSLNLAAFGFAFTLPEFFLAGVLGGFGGGVAGLASQAFLGGLKKAHGSSSGIYEVFTNIGQWLGTWGSGLIAVSFGIRKLFIFSAAISLVAGLSFLLTKEKASLKLKSKNKK